MAALVTSLDETSRVRLGAASQTPPAVLENLTADASVMVRVALAMNPATPAGADRALAVDSDERVRALLARKLAGLVRGLSLEERDRLQQQALETLTALVSDEAE